MSAHKFIVFDGVEGAGKSTQLEIAFEYLVSRGLEVIRTREPGGTALGNRLREILLHSDDLGITAETELLLMFAARQQHLERVIQPALADGKWVLCDRFSDASFAYQGGGRGIANERIERLVEWVQNGFRPAHVVIFDIEPEIGLERLQRYRNKDRFEKEQLDFYKRVRVKFLEIASANPNRYTLINANRSLEEVRDNVLNVIESIIHGYSLRL